MQFVSYLSSIPLKLISLAVSVPIAALGTCYDVLFKKLPDEPHKILITGASSGICKEVALQYAKPVVLFDSYNSLGKYALLGCKKCEASKRSCRCYS